MESVDALDGFAVLRGGAEFVVRVNALEEEDAALDFHLAGDFAHQPPAACIDAARFQRAPEGSGQSTAGRRHHVIEGCGARRKILRRHLVVLGNL